MSGWIVPAGTGQAEKPAANTSAPSNPHAAEMSDFRRMFESAD